MTLGFAQCEERDHQHDDPENDHRDADDAVTPVAPRLLSGEAAVLCVQCSNLDAQSTSRPLALPTCP